jgi:hypothetical protein
MSYHLRLLAGHDFVREVPGRGQGRERWWEASPQPAWIPREGLSTEAQAEVSGLRPMAWADALEGFERFRAARQAMGEWGQGTWVRGRAKLTLTREEAVQFIADQQELVRRYQRDANGVPPGARTVMFASATYPEPTSDEEPGLPRSANTRPIAAVAHRPGRLRPVARDFPRAGISRASIGAKTIPAPPPCSKGSAGRGGGPGEREQRRYRLW